MVMNTSLFCPSNILLDPDNPCSPPPESIYYGEVNSGTWMKSAISKECSLPNHILMPFCHFIDGLKVDKYGELTIEAVLTCCLWFNKKARNRASTWWVQGLSISRRITSSLILIILVPPLLNQCIMVKLIPAHG